MRRSEVRQTIEHAPSPTVVARAAHITHEMWKPVFVRLEASKGNTQPERVKPLNLDKALDRQTLAHLTEVSSPALRDTETAPKIDIIQVGLEHTPAAIQEGSRDSASLALQAVDHRVDTIRKGAKALLPKGLVLRGMAREVEKVEDALHKQQQGEALSARDERRLRESWVFQGAFDVHALWARSNAERLDLQGQYPTLDPYEKEKDVIFVKGAVQARREGNLS